ncbi:MAG: hypothetical protein Q9184_006319 [Pyrenodesmia sp. 2 TL-2023]
MSTGWQSDEGKTAALHQMVMNRLGEIRSLLKELGLDSGNGAACTPPDDHTPVLDSIIGLSMAARRPMSESANTPNTTKAIATNYKSNLIPSLQEACKGYFPSHRGNNLISVWKPPPQMSTAIEAEWSVMNKGKSEKDKKNTDAEFQRTPKARSPTHGGKEEKKKPENCPLRACNEPLCEPFDYNMKTVSDIREIL